MTDVPVVSQIILETIAGVCLIFVIWFVFAVVHEIVRRIRVKLWVRKHKEERNE
jgi:hypothetical protein